MIGLLRGTYWRSEGSELVLDVRGVGYRLVATRGTIDMARATEGPVEISVHTALRQDALVLYGFADESERTVFEILVTTPGVGPSLAMATLGSLGADGVAAAVATEDTTAFESVSGVGKKTAARIVLELKGKELGGTVGAIAPAPSAQRQSDVALALAELGYGPAEIKRATEEIPGEMEVGAALRLALRTLGKGVA